MRRVSWLICLPWASVMINSNTFSPSLILTPLHKAKATVLVPFWCAPSKFKPFTFSPFNFKVNVWPGTYLTATLTAGIAG